MTESVLQLGAGRFLRGFIDRIISDQNRSENPVGSVVVVQSTPGNRATLLNENRTGFPVVVRGIVAGDAVEHTSTVNCISRALVAEDRWSEVLACAASPSMRLIVSNATEAGYILSPNDSSVPTTLPGKLTRMLESRYRAGVDPVTILPCELISQNATRLCDLVVRQAEEWQLDSGFIHYIQDQCIWLNTLVDCIISDLPIDDTRVRSNPLAIMAEPYALLAIEQPANSLFDRKTFPLAMHPAVEIVSDLEPYYLRKVRMLNGVHTAMVATYFGSSLLTVQQVIADGEGRRWVRDLLYGEILPTVIGKVDGAVKFADDVLDRFANPYLAHPLADIRLNHEQKVPVRLIPTADDFQQIFGFRPPLLQAAINRKLAN